MITIWHNPHCSKSREVLKILQQRGDELTVRKYREDPPNADEIRAALKALKLEAKDIIRMGEPLFKSLGLTAKTDADTFVNAMADNPILIERPIVFVNILSGGRAAIGRPPENVLAIL